MVLEDTSNPDSFSSDSSPSSDLDPYSSPSSSSNKLYDLSGLPKPFPILGPLAGFTRAAQTHSIDTNLEHASKLLSRPLRPVEAQTLAFHYCRMSQFSSYGMALGAAWGVLRSYQTRETFAFLFWKPDLQRFNPDSFGPLKGNMARYALHGIRAQVYGTVFWVLGAAVASSYAASTSAAMMATNPEMKEFNEVLRNQVIRKARGELQREGLPVSREVQERWESEASRIGPDQAKQQQRQQRQRQQQLSTWSSRRSSTDDDDMSPQAADYPSSDSRSSDFEDLTGPSSGFSTPSRPDTSYSSDDASPVRRESTSSGGSAWDRIRRGEAPSSAIPRNEAPNPPSPSPQNRGSWAQRRAGSETTEGATSGDSFAFSTSEEDRQLAKAEAQREFDARVERERMGRDFSGEDGRRGKW
ncbi:hypothetical protein M501DRAFT_389626 [Patellaria atrata CBS 101060]|uniref:Uncharacterized protein n=1 Tax=Patellaria atrata CBS 101060 TaxID=1346257 RepID=A0A9P4VSL1_9PEZI|nr:hypothetical protein M501DRAFT_389626 [Patellaria atrata CBS 101060]